MRISFVPLLLAIGPACADGNEHSGEAIASEAPGARTAAAGDSTPGAAPTQRITEFILAAAPPAESATTQEKGDWVLGRSRLLEELRSADAEVGHAALAAFRSAETDLVDVQADLLDVAAHTVPDEAIPLLAELTETYGPDPYVRGEAARLLARVAPERALALLEPVILEPYSDQTWPARETILDACLTASRATDHATANLLCAVAIDIHQLDSVRHRAVRELGEESGSRVEATLEEILIEPTGNAYLRRLAAQSALKVLDTEPACALFTRVADREADERFLIFLRDVLAKNCS